MTLAGATDRLRREERELAEAGEEGIDEGRGSRALGCTSGHDRSPEHLRREVIAQVFEREEAPGHTHAVHCRTPGELGAAHSVQTLDHARREPRAAQLLLGVGGDALAGLAERVKVSDVGERELAFHRRHLQTRHAQDRQVRARRQLAL